MTQSNFQDVVSVNSLSITLGVEALVIGTDAGSKSLCFAWQSAQASAGFLVALNPTTQNTVVLPAANGSVGFFNTINASGLSATNGTLSFANFNGVVWGGNVSTLTAALTRVSALTLNDYAATVAQSSTMSSALAGAYPTTSSSSGNASAIRMTMIAPMNVSYLDPGGQNQIKLTGSIALNGIMITGFVTWWAGVYTMNGSTASIASSTSGSTSVSMSFNGTTSSSTSANIDNRFTNLGWNFTLGDYLLVIGSTLALSANNTTSLVNNPTATYGASLLETCFGATRAQVSYSVPYFADGTATTSANSYHLTNIVASGGTGATSLAPRLMLVGT